MATLKTPVQFADELDPLNAPRPLSVDDSLRGELSLLIADRTTADVDGSGQGVIVRANAVGSLLTFMPPDLTAYQMLFMSWIIGNDDIKTIAYTQRVKMLMIQGTIMNDPEILTWCKADGTPLAAYWWGVISWVPVRGQTFYFKRSDVSLETMCGVWGFY